MRNIIVWVVVLCAAVAGCESRTTTANKLRNDTLVQTASISTASQNSRTSMAAADMKVVTATTQPGVPKSAMTLLAGAHADLVKGQAALDPIVTAVANINGNADKAAKVTAESENALTTERASFWSYKQRNIWYLCLALLIPLAIGAFVIQSFGAGPVMQVIGGIAGNILSGIWSVIKFIGKALGHTLTLGSVWFASRLNAKYDQIEAAKANNTGTVFNGSIQA